jgi:ribonuclease HI
MPEFYNSGMMNLQTELVHVLSMAQRLGVSPGWLRQEAKAGHLPCIDCGGTLLFNPTAVKQALAKRATQPLAVMPEGQAAANEPLGASTSTAVLFTDGGCLPNPGDGAGAWVLRRNGQILSSRASYIGRTTNNVAEYTGLIYGLEAALDLGIDRIEVYSDSRLIVEQVNGRWQVRAIHLKELHDKAKRLLARFRSWTLDWIPRLMNAEADELANEAAREHRDIGEAT